MSLRVFPVAGLPLQEFEVWAQVSASVVQLALYPFGPGVVESLETEEPDKLRLRAGVPGIYYITGEAQDSRGGFYSGSTAFLVHDKEELDQLLRNKWEAMKDRLFLKDLEGALELFLDESKETYRTIFAALLERLPQIVTDMQDIEMIYARGGEAKYRIERVHEDGASITYYIYFAWDKHGIWKIDWF